MDIVVELRRRRLACQDVQGSLRRSEPVQASLKQENVERTSLIRLWFQNAATSLSDLRLPGLHLEPLKADRKGQHCIRINDRYRICFKWRDGDAHDVEIVDYH